MIFGSLPISDLSQYIALFGYFGIFLFFLTIDQITPIPEEMSLLTIGYFSSKEVFNPFIAGATALSAFVIVDSIYFALVKSGTKHSAWIKKKMENRVLEKVSSKIRENFRKALFIVCFIPRMRLWAPIASSLAQIPYWRFLKYDAIYLTCFTSLYTALGFFFHRELHNVISNLEIIQDSIFFGLILVSTLLILISIRKQQHEQKS
jgi:membrane protein DedA with SNARE-associated domain